MKQNGSSTWRLAHRADKRVQALAERHYNGDTPGLSQIAPPGRCIVLLAGDSDKEAVWVSSCRNLKSTNGDSGDAWVCSLFHNESSKDSGQLIHEALSVTRHMWGDPPTDGMLAFMDPAKIECKCDPNDYFCNAGFEPNDQRKNGRQVLRIDNGSIPAPYPPRHEQLKISFRSSSSLPAIVADERWESAVSWVNANRRIIIGWARSRMQMSGYDVEDFIQQAYLSAYQALCSKEVVANPPLFERYLWGVFKIQCFKMMVNPKSPEDSTASNGINIDQADFDALVKNSLKVMAPNERNVWRRLLGESCKKRTLTEVAKELKLTRRRIMQIRDAGLKRVREHFAHNTL